MAQRFCCGCIQTLQPHWRGGVACCLKGAVWELSCFPSSTNVLLLIVDIPVLADQYNQSVLQPPSLQVLNDVLKWTEDTVTANTFGFHLNKQNVYCLLAMSSFSVGSWTHFKPNRWFLPRVVQLWVIAWHLPPTCKREQIGLDVPGQFVGNRQPVCSGVAWVCFPPPGRQQVGRTWQTSQHQRQKREEKWKIWPYLGFCVTLLG